jgi:hypothetical protein
MRHPASNLLCFYSFNYMPSSGEQMQRPIRYQGSLQGQDGYSFTRAHENMADFSLSLLKISLQIPSCDEKQYRASEMDRFPTYRLRWLERGSITDFLTARLYAVKVRVETHPLVADEAPFQNTQKSWGKKYGNKPRDQD